jgi:hypothetical protein
MSTTPVVESLVFSEKLPPDPKNPWRLDLPITESHAFRYYEARSQSTAFFLREITSPNAVLDPKTPGLLAARFENEAWFHDSFGERAFILQITDEPGSRLHNTAVLNSTVLRQVLTLGLMHSDPGSVRWQGNSFHVANPALGLRIRGKLNSTIAGVPGSLRVTYSNQRGDIQWVIRYRYDDLKLTHGLPCSIRCFWINPEGREIERLAFGLLEVKTSPTPLGRAAFDPVLIRTNNNWQAHVLKGEEIYSVLPSGKLDLIAKLRNNPPLKKGSKAEVARFGIVYAGWGVVNASIFILALRVNTKHKTK